MTGAASGNVHDAQAIGGEDNVTGGCLIAVLRTHGAVSNSKAGRLHK